MATPEVNPSAPVAGQRMTLGAWRRRAGVDPARRARVVRWRLACELVAELRRQLAAEEWWAIGRALERGWPPCQLARRMRALADLLDPPETAA